MNINVAFAAEKESLIKFYSLTDNGKMFRIQY